MTRWARGEAEVEQLLGRSELEAVTGAAADGALLLAQARRTAATAAGLVTADAYSAYILAYDAARYGLSSGRVSGPSRICVAAATNSNTLTCRPTPPRLTKRNRPSRPQSG